MEMVHSRGWLVINSTTNFPFSSMCVYFQPSSVRADDSRWWIIWIFSLFDWLKASPCSFAVSFLVHPVHHHQRLFCILISAEFPFLLVTGWSNFNGLPSYQVSFQLIPINDLEADHLNQCHSSVFVGGQRRSSFADLPVVGHWRMFENRISVCWASQSIVAFSVSSPSSWFRVQTEMLKNKSTSEMVVASSEDLQMKSKLEFELEQVSAMTIAHPQQEFNRMNPYFKQPELPASFKFMEPYFRDYERNWKLVLLFLFFSTQLIIVKFKPIQILECFFLFVCLFSNLRFEKFHGDFEICFSFYLTETVIGFNNLIVEFRLKSHRNWSGI